MLWKSGSKLMAENGSILLAIDTFIKTMTLGDELIFCKTIVFLFLIGGYFLKRSKLTMFFCIFIYADLSFAQTCVSNIIADAPDSRYTANANGTVVDIKTGLTWMRCAIGQTWNSTTCTDAAKYDNWDGASETAESTVFAGLNDWRIPTREELESLLEKRCRGPAINLTAFPNATNDWFWSYSPYSSTSYGGWIVSFENGDGMTGWGDGGGHAVRLVRGVLASQNNPSKGVGDNYFNVKKTKDGLEIEKVGRNLYLYDKDIHKHGSSASFTIESHTSQPNSTLSD